MQPLTGRKQLDASLTRKRQSVHKIFVYNFGDFSEGENCHKSKQFGEILPYSTPGYLFMLGRSAASKIIYVRPVGGPQNTSNIGKILT